MDDDNMDNNRFSDLLLDWLIVNKGKVLGVFLGLLFGWLTIKYGFFMALFVAICVALGYLLGSCLDNGNHFFQHLADKLHSSSLRNKRR